MQFALSKRGRKYLACAAAFVIVLVVRASETCILVSSLHLQRQDVRHRQGATVYLCGYDLSVFVKAVLPDYATAHLRPESNVKPYDYLAVGMHKPCPGAELFPGQVFYLNGESKTTSMVLNSLYLGPVRVPNRTHMQYYYASYAVLALGALEKLKVRPSISKDRFLLYVQSHCVPEREAAFAFFASIGEVSAAGKCHGGLEKYEQVVRVGDDWIDDIDIYGRFKFGLVMENTVERGYVTEKIVAAYAGGSVPIYYGTEDVFNIFNSEAFIFYDKGNPEKTLRIVQSLLDNATAYEEIFAQPLTTEVQHQEYFSLFEGGKLYHLMRRFLGVDKGAKMTSRTTGKARVKDINSFSE